MALPGADSVEFDGYRVGDFLGEGTVPGGVFVNAVPQRRGDAPQSNFSRSPAGRHPEHVSDTDTAKLRGTVPSDTFNIHRLSVVGGSKGSILLMPVPNFCAESIVNSASSKMAWPVLDERTG